MADTASRQRIALTSGTAGTGFVDVSPDGHRIVFNESVDDYDLASVDVQHATAKRLIATQRDEYMPAGPPKNRCWHTSPIATAPTKSGCIRWGRTGPW
jgi:hypothetical protein